MTDEKPRHRRGCFFYGCIASSLLLAIILVAALLGLRVAKKLVTDFTDTKPATFPEVKLSQSELDALQQRIETFRGAVKQGQPTGPLTLNADEINGLIATDPDLKDFKRKLYVIMEGDQLKAQVSVPMEQIGLPMFQGRYLNGTATFELALRNGAIRLTPQSFVSKGRPLPDVYMEKVRKQNLARNLNSDPRAQAALDRLHEIKVKDGKLVLAPKSP
jgi:hypothetical protein